MNKQVSIKILFSLLFTLSTTVLAAPGLGNTQPHTRKACAKLAGVEVKLDIYQDLIQCPAKDPKLKQALLPLANNTHIQKAICKTTSSPSDCMHSALSIKDEATGLHNILSMAHPSRDFCNMASEDTSQLLFYVGSYIKKRCR